MFSNQNIHKLIFGKVDLLGILIRKSESFDNSSKPKIQPKNWSSGVGKSKRQTSEIYKILFWKDSFFVKITDPRNKAITRGP